MFTGVTILDPKPADYFLCPEGRLRLGVCRSPARSQGKIIRRLAVPINFSRCEADKRPHRHRGLIFTAYNVPLSVAQVFDRLFTGGNCYAPDPRLRPALLIHSSRTYGFLYDYQYRPDAWSALFDSQTQELQLCAWIPAI